MSERAKAWAEKLSVIGWTLGATAVTLLMAAYFDYPWVVGIGFQLLFTAAVVGGILLYGKAKASKIGDRYDKKAGIVSCMMVALFLGPAVLNAAEVATWTPIAESEHSSLHLAYGAVCAANDGGNGSGAMFGFAAPAPTAPPTPSSAAPQNSVLVCIGLALGALGLTAGCIAVVISVVGATGGVGVLGALKIAAACLAALSAIIIAIAVCFTDGDDTLQRVGGHLDVKLTDASTLLPLTG